MSNVVRCSNACCLQAIKVQEDTLYAQLQSASRETRCFRLKYFLKPEDPSLCSGGVIDHFSGLPSVLGGFGLKISRYFSYLPELSGTLVYFPFPNKEYSQAFARKNSHFTRTPRTTA